MSTILRSCFILFGFFIGACLVLMLGIAVYVWFKSGWPEAWELIASAWRLWLLGFGMVAIYCWKWRTRKAPD